MRIEFNYLTKIFFSEQADASFLPRGVNRDQYFMYHEYVRNQTSRMPYIPRYVNICKSRSSQTKKISLF